MAQTKDNSKVYVVTEQGRMPVKTALDFLRYYYQEDVLLALYDYADEYSDWYVLNQIRLFRKRRLSSRKGGSVASQGNLPRTMQQSAGRETPDTTQLNYFAPKKSLQELLRQEWFAEMCTDATYDARWTDAFVDALMGSEWRNSIATDWTISGKRSKRNQIKGYVVGLLADAGVLKGSYDKIAAKVGVTDEPRSFSRYMGLGKKQPFADWVMNYLSAEKR